MQLGLETGVNRVRTVAAAAMGQTDGIAVLSGGNRGRTTLFRSGKRWKMTHTMSVSL